MAGGSYRELIDRLVLTGVSGVFLLSLGAVTKLYDQYSKTLEDHSAALEKTTDSLNRLHARLERQEERLEGAGKTLDGLSQEVRRLWGRNANSATTKGSEL